MFSIRATISKATVGAGYIPPLSVETLLIDQGRHICRPYKSLVEIEQASNSGIVVLIQ